MSTCYSCENHSNPLKMGYRELVFAWRPVKTDDGWIFLKKVHKVPNYIMQSNLVGSWPDIFYTYAKHKEEGLQQ